MEAEMVEKEYLLCRYVKKSTLGTGSRRGVQLSEASNNASSAFSEADRCAGSSPAMRNEDHLVAALQGGDAERVGRHPGPEQLLGPGDPLDVVGVGVGGDDHLAGGQVEVHLADQVDNLVRGVKKSDVDQ